MVKKIERKRGYNLFNDVRNENNIQATYVEIFKTIGDYEIDLAMPHIIKGYEKENFN